MKLAGCVVALVLSMTGAAAAQTGNMAAVEKQLIANERAVNEAVAKADVKAFRRLVNPAGLGIDPTGLMMIGDYEKMIAALKVTTWNIDQIRVLWLTPDAAVVSYRWTGDATLQGQRLPSPTLASTVWVKQADGRWLATFHQETTPLPAK